MKTHLTDALCLVWLYGASAVMIVFNAFDRVWESALRFARAEIRRKGPTRAGIVGLGRDPK